MNAYVKASVASHGWMCAIFFGVPVLLLTTTQNATNGMRIFGWLLCALLGTAVGAILIGHINRARANVGWPLVLAEAVVVLLGCAVGAALPGVFGESRREAIVVATWVFVYGLAPALLAGIVHYGMLQKIPIEEPNKAPEPTTMAVTSRAPSSTSRASHGRGSS